MAQVHQNESQDPDQAQGHMPGPPTAVAPASDDFGLLDIAEHPEIAGRAAEPEHDGQNVGGFQGQVGHEPKVAGRCPHGYSPKGSGHQPALNCPQPKPPVAAEPLRSGEGGWLGNLWHIQVRATGLRPACLKMARHPSLRSRGTRSSPANTVTRAIFSTIQEKGCRPSADLPKILAARRYPPDPGG